MRLREGPSTGCESPVYLSPFGSLLSVSNEEGPPGLGAF